GWPRPLCHQRVEVHPADLTDLPIRSCTWDSQARVTTISRGVPKPYDKSPRPAGMWGHPLARVQPNRDRDQTTDSGKSARAGTLGLAVPSPEGLGENTIRLRLVARGTVASN